MRDLEAAHRLIACEQQVAAPRSLWQGGQLAGRYQVEQWLGQGAHGVVYRALDLGTGALVVIKQVDDHQQARQEAHLLAELEHSALVSLLDYVCDEVAAYLVLPFIEGLPLLAWTAGAEGQQRLLEVGEVLEVGRQLAQVFTYLHALPVVHRDIHSENLLRQPDGRIRVIDFSLAGRLVAGSPSTASEVQAELGSVRALLARLLPPGAQRGLPDACAGALVQECPSPPRRWSAISWLWRRNTVRSRARAGPPARAFPSPHRPFPDQARAAWSGVLRVADSRAGWPCAMLFTQRRSLYASEISPGDGAL